MSRKKSNENHYDFNISFFFGGGGSFLLLWEGDWVVEDVLSGHVVHKKLL